MTLVERSTIPSSSSYGSSGRTQAADVPNDDLPAQGAAAILEAKTNIEGVSYPMSAKKDRKLSITLDKKVKKPWTARAELATRSLLQSRNRSRRDPTQPPWRWLWPQGSWLVRLGAVKEECCVFVEPISNRTRT